MFFRIRISFKEREFGFAWKRILAWKSIHTPQFIMIMLLHFLNLHLILSTGLLLINKCTICKNFFSESFKKIKGLTSAVDLQPFSNTKKLFLSGILLLGGGLWHQMYEKLKMNVASAAFLEKLKSFSLNGDGMTSSDSILVKTEGEKFLPDSFLNWLQIPYEWMTSRVSEDWFRTLFSSDCKFRSIEDPSRVGEFFFSWTLFQVIANSIRKWRPLESKFPNSFSCDLDILRRLWKWLLLCFGYVLKSCQWNSPYL